MSSQTDKSQVLRAASAMGAATFLSRILGLVREQVFAYFFGASNAMDAFQIAFRIPNLLRDLFAEGAMSAALVPTFIRVRKEQGEVRAWRVAGLVFRTLFLAVSVLTLIGVFFASDLVGLYASAFKETPGKFELTVFLTQVLFPFFPLVVLAAAFMGILNACGAYFIPAFSSALFNLVSVVSGVLFVFVGPMVFGAENFEPILGMAIGVVLGGAVQAFSQFPLLKKKGYRYVGLKEAQNVRWHQDPDLRRMLLLMVPGTVGLAATQINILVNSVLATSEGTGAVSWLNYAFRFMQFPIGIFGVSLAQATLPVVSAYWVEKNLVEFDSTLKKSLRQMFAINLPASAALGFLGVPIIEMIFEYGRFQSQDTAQTALALAFYAGGLTAYSAVKVLVPVFYSMANTRIPVISSVLSVGVNVGLNLFLVGSLGFAGLALGTSLTAALNALFLIFALKWILRSAHHYDFQLGVLVKSMLQHFAVAMTMGAICWMSWRGLRFGIDEIFGSDLSTGLKILTRALLMGVLTLEGAFLAWVLGKLFGVSELDQALEVFSKKIKKKLGIASR